MNQKNTFLIAILSLILGIACKQKVQVSTASTGNPLIDHLSVELQNNPQNDSLWSARAAAYSQAEDYDNAVKDVLRALSLDSINIKYQHQLANAFLDGNKSYEAIRTMEHAAAMYPERTPTLLKLAECYLIVQQYEPALKAIHTVNVVDPKNDEGYFMMGRVLLEMNEKERAMKAFQTCVANNAENPDAWVYLGQLYDEKKNPLALQCFDNALRFDSLNTDILYNKAMHHQQYHEDEKAKVLYRKIIGLDRKYADAFFNMGVLLLEKKDSLQKAFNNFDMLVKTDPIYIKGYYFRGMCYERLNKISEAKQDYQQALNLMPDYNDAKIALNRLNVKN